jgi:molybdate transport system substrate-binding protein
MEARERSRPVGVPFLRLAQRLRSALGATKRTARGQACGSAALLFLIFFSACRRTAVPEKSSGGEILVSAAASLQDAYREIARRFLERAGVKVTLNFASSGELEKQIEFGAPADVFASAGEREMNNLAAKGLIDAATRADFAGNVLVLAVPAASKASLKNFSELASVERIAIGNPETVPAGHYAQQSLVRSHLWDQVKGRLIFAENVRQALEYVAHGEADAGLVYATDIPVAQGRVKMVVAAPEGTYGPIRYPIAVIQGTRHAEAAREFVRFVLGSEGQSVLKQYGFIPAK